METDNFKILKLENIIKELEQVALQIEIRKTRRMPRSIVKQTQGIPTLVRAWAFGQGVNLYRCMPKSLCLR